MAAVSMGSWRPWRPWRRTGQSLTEVESKPDENVPRVIDYMTPVAKLVTLAPDMSLSEAACKLCDKKISGAPVVADNKRLLGVLSQKDLLYQAAGRGHVRFVTEGPRSQRVTTNERRLRNILDSSVGDLMSVRPVMISATATMHDAANLLLDRKISRLPVVDEGRLVGLLSLTDVIATVTSRDGGCAIFD